jgi:hypothetical protein
VEGQKLNLRKESEEFVVVVKLLNTDKVYIDILKINMMECHLMLLNLNKSLK